VTVEHLTVDVVKSFLTYLEQERGNAIQYLCQLRKAEGGLRGMHTTQAGDLVENLASENWLRLFRKPLYRLLHVFGAAPVGLQVQDAGVGSTRMDVSPETVRDMDHAQRQI